MQLVERQNSVSYIVVVAARWTKSLKFTLSIAVHRGGLAKNHFLACGDAKKENWTTTKLFLKHVSYFHGQKIKENVLCAVITRIFRMTPLERERGNLNFKRAVVCVDERQFENLSGSYLHRKVTYI